MEHLSAGHLLREALRTPLRNEARVQLPKLRVRTFGCFESVFLAGLDFMRFSTVLPFSSGGWRRLEVAVVVVAAAVVGRNEGRATVFMSVCDVCQEGK